MNKKWYEIIISGPGVLISGMMHLAFIAFCFDLKEQVKIEYGAILSSSLFALSYLLLLVIINVVIHNIKKKKQ